MKRLPLQEMETKLIELLVSYPKETVSFERISHYIWGEKSLRFRKITNVGISIKAKSRA